VLRELKQHDAGGLLAQPAGPYRQLAMPGQALMRGDPVLFVFIFPARRRTPVAAASGGERSISAR